MEINFQVRTVADFEEDLMNFYKSCERETKLDKSDTVVVARIDSKIVGVVRLCFENGFYVLRTMQISPHLQGQGIGRVILGKFKEMIQARKIDKVYCMPYDHLEYFYGIMGFKKITESDSPAFLSARANDFHKRHASKRVILMST